MQTSSYKRGHVIDFIPAADVAAGDVIVQGDLVGIAALDIKAETLGSLRVSGIFTMPKATTSGSAIAAGVKVYWNASACVITTESDDGGSPATAYPYIGKTTEAADDDAATMRVRLSQ